jgi:hypothetical protein
MRRFVAVLLMLIGTAAAAAVAAPAASASVSCDVSRSSDGHRFGADCYRVGSSNDRYFRFTVTACGPGACSTLGTAWTPMGSWAWINAGSGYIDQNSARFFFTT